LGMYVVDAYRGEGGAVCEEGIGADKGCYGSLEKSLRLWVEAWRVELHGRGDLGPWWFGCSGSNVMVLESLPWWSGLARQHPRWFMAERAAWLSAGGNSMVRRLALWGVS